MSRKKGFTLIELLVVIAIIAILAAILFPVFARARAKAKASSCLAQVKQLALAFKMYESDWDDKFCGPLWGSYGPMWCEAIYPYVKNKQLFICPADSNPLNYNSSAYVPYWTNVEKCSYSFNGANQGGCGFSDAYRPNWGMSTTENAWDLVNTIIIFDSIGGHPNNHRCYNPATCGTTGITGSFYSDRHNGGSNVAWCDGHVSWKTVPTQCAWFTLIVD